VQQRRGVRAALLDLALARVGPLRELLEWRSVRDGECAIAVSQKAEAWNIDGQPSALPLRDPQRRVAQLNSRP